MAFKYDGYRMEFTYLSMFHVESYLEIAIRSRRAVWLDIEMKHEAPSESG